MRARYANPAAARLTAGIVLMLIVLLPLQSVSAVMARLWRPAHYHPSLLAAVHVPDHDAGAARSKDAVDAAAAPGFATQHPLPSAALHPQPVVESGPHHPHAHARSHPHLHASAHAHAREQATEPGTAPNPHAIAHGHRHTRADIPAPVDRLPSATIASPDHRTALATHAQAHETTGVGHHRHDRDDPDVVLVEDADAPDAPATAPRRQQVDGSVMLLPTALALPAIASLVGNMRGLPAAPLRAHFVVPPTRPPR